MTYPEIHPCGLTEAGHWVNFTGIKMALGTEPRQATIREVTADALLTTGTQGAGDETLALHPAGLALAQAAFERGENEITVYGHQVLRVGERWASYTAPGELTPCQAVVADPGFAGGPFV